MKIKRTIKRMGSVQFYFPIERIDEEKRTAEGYAFCNEVVEGEGGVRLKRTAMQAATPDYQEWGAIREMHGDTAAATLLDLKWDDKGCFIRCEVTDDQAWKKVLKRTYKGFSVGVRATVMRGNVVEKAKWIETSLVDRPADPDAKIMCFRSAVADPGDEQDVEVLEERSATADDPKALKKEIKRLNKVIEELKAAPAGADITRLQGEKTELLTRVQALETELKATKAERKAARKEIKRLLQQPAAVPPVRYPSAYQREFTANDGNDGSEVADALKEFNDLRTSLANEPDADKRQKGAARLNMLKGTLSNAGMNV